MTTQQIRREIAQLATDEDELGSSDVERLRMLRKALDDRADA